MKRIQQAWQFGKALAREIRKDNLSTSAAALAFYMTLAVFPAMIVLLTVLPYLPIPRLSLALTDLLRQVLPPDAAQLFTGTVVRITRERRGGLLSFGLLLAVGAASRGMTAVMHQLNATYSVNESRSFLRVHATALALTFIYFVLVVIAFTLIVGGGMVQGWIGRHFGFSVPLLLFFSVLRWVILFAALLFSFSITYTVGPDVKRKFRFVTRGSLFAAIAFVIVSFGFRLYVANMADFDATYGSLGAVIVFMTWLLLTGWVLLLGAEIDSMHRRT